MALGSLPGNVRPCTAGCRNPALRRNPSTSWEDGPPALSLGPRPIPALPCSFVEERYESELARASAVLDGVDRALERLSEGTYGQCETCGAPVLDADLERDPARRMCAQHLSPA
jgi:hypothetical protein